MSDVTEPAPAADLTIEELSARTGMTVRNIRAHQSRGLVPGPVVRGRTGYYGQAHVDRLQLIRDMQADGLNLAAIAKLVGSGGEEFAGFRQALAQPFESAGMEIIDGADLVEMLGGDVSPENVARAEKLGIVRPLGDGRYESSARIIRAATEVGRIGIDADVALDLLEKVDRHGRAVAKLFVDLFLDEVWKPFQAAGMPSEEWPRVRDAVERLRPLAGDALLAMFEPAMTVAVDRAAEKAVERIGRDAEKGR